MAAVQLLFVEDDPVQRKLVDHHLKSLSELTFETCHATGEVAALDAFRTKPFDLVILDYLLEQGNGLHLLRVLRQLNPVIPIIAVSGIATSEVAAKLVRAGADDFFNKRELTSDTLGRGIRNGLRRSEAIRQRLETARNQNDMESLESRLTGLCRAYAASVSPEMFSQMELFEVAARQSNIAAPDLEKLFSRAIAGLEASGQARNLPARLYRPLILETLMRLFDDVPPSES